MVADPPCGGADYSLSLWLWNGLGTNIRPETGEMFAFGAAGNTATSGDRLFLKAAADVHDATATLVFANGKNQQVAGASRIEPRRWYHVAVVRAGRQVTLYLDGEPEGNGAIDASDPAASRLYLGSRPDAAGEWEGRLADVALFDRALIERID